MECSDEIPTSTHFNCNGHNFQLYAKFTLIERLNKLNIEKKHYENDLKLEKTLSYKTTIQNKIFRTN